MDQFVIDLSPLTGPLVEIVAAVIIAVVGLGIRLALNLFSLKTGLQVEAEQRQKINEALENAINFAKGRVTRWADAHSDIKVKDELVSQAANYVLRTVPEALAYLDVTPDNVASLVESRLAKAI